MGGWWLIALTVVLALVLIVFAVTIAAASSLQPVAAPPTIRVVVAVVAAVGAGLLLVSMGVDWWYVVEAEDVVTDTDTVRGDYPVPLLAVVSGLTAAALIVAGCYGRRSFAGAALVLAWALIGVVWMAFLLENSSSRSSADLRLGPTLATWAMAVVTSAALISWTGRLAVRRRRKAAD